MRNYLNSKTNKILERTTSVIKNKDAAFPHDVDEKDLKETINKWKANERKKEVLHAIN